MFTKLSDFFLIQTYRSVYGSKAKFAIKGDVVEIIAKNKKIIRNKKNGNKIEESYYEGNKVTLMKYSPTGIADIEEIYIDGKKISEKKIGENKDISKDFTLDGIDKTTSVYTEDGKKVVEEVYIYKEKDKTIQYTVKDKDYEIIKEILIKEKDETVLDTKKVGDKEGRVFYYKENGSEVEVSYYGNGRHVKDYSKYYEEPIYEEVTEVQNTKSKKNKQDSKEKKQIGTKITKEIINYNEHDKIIYVEDNEKMIHREFDKDGNLMKQYTIITTDKGKEVIGKIITDKDIKLINNSTIPNDRIVLINEEMDRLDAQYDERHIITHDCIVNEHKLTIADEHYELNNKLELKKKTYEKVENNIPYNIEETYRKEKLYCLRKINQISKTEFVTEGNRKFVKGYNGIEKEVSDEEFEVYKIADEFNKLK